MSSTNSVFVSDTLRFTPSSIKKPLQFASTDGIAVVQAIVERGVIEVEELFFLVHSCSSDRFCRGSDLVLNDEIQALCLKDGSWVFTLPASLTSRTLESFECDEYFESDCNDQVGLEGFL